LTVRSPKRPTNFRDPRNAAGIDVTLTLVSSTFVELGAGSDGARAALNPRALAPVTTEKAPRTYARIHLMPLSVAIVITEWLSAIATLTLAWVAAAQYLDNKKTRDSRTRGTMPRPITH
jgi:hypothetical protein